MLMLVSGGTADWPLHRGRLSVGQLVSPRAGNAIWADRWAIDNDAFSRSGFDPDAFRSTVGRLAETPGCLFVASPDIVGNASGTVDRFAEWLPFLRSRRVPVALVGQDGFEDLEVDYWLGLADAWFVGGSTAWKLSEAALGLTQRAKALGKWAHMGRVNTRSRFLRAAADGYDSIDGTGWSKFPREYQARGERWALELDQPLMF